MLIYRIQASKLCKFGIKWNTFDWSTFEWDCRLVWVELGLGWGEGGQLLSHQSESEWPLASSSQCLACLALLLLTNSHQHCHHLVLRWCSSNWIATNQTASSSPFACLATQHWVCGITFIAIAHTFDTFAFDISPTASLSNERLEDGTMKESV